MRTRHTGPAALVIGCVLAAFLLNASAGVAGSRRLVATTCPKFNGPRWFFSASTSGTKYTLETSGGYRCSTATVWVKKLAVATLPSNKQNVHYTIAGPAGFSCEASPDTHRHAFTGSCEKFVKGSPTKLGFVWTSSFF
jgi:hypothetical protein